MICAVPIETFVRESIGKELLSRYLLMRGYKVVTGNYIDVFEYSINKKVDLIIINNVDDNAFNRKYLKELSSKGTGIILLQNEGLIAPNYSDIIERMRTPLLKYVNEYWAWGSGIHNYFLNAELPFFGVSYVIGHPMFEVAKRNIFVPKMARPKFGDYVLFNTNFSLINEAVQGQYILESNYDRREHMRKVRESLINLICTLSTAYPRMNFVIRPHPSESISYYEKRVAGRQNIKVIYEHRALDWIYYSKCLVHNGCTTAIEACLLKKPVVSYVEVKNVKFDIRIADNAGVRLDTHEAVIDFVSTLANEREYETPDLSNDIANFSESFEKILDRIQFQYASEERTSRISFGFILRNYLRYFIPLKFLSKQRRQDFIYRRRKYSIENHRQLIKQFRSFNIESNWKYVNLIVVENG